MDGNHTNLKTMALLMTMMIPFMLVVRNQRTGPPSQLPDHSVLDVSIKCQYNVVAISMIIGVPIGLRIVL